MTPYYDHAGITLYHGDALGILPSLTTSGFQAVITDPPYASGGVKAGERISPTTSEKYVNHANGKPRADFSGDQLDQRVWRKWCREWLTLCKGLLCPGGYCLSFIDWRQLPAMTDAFQLAGIYWRGILAWDKGESAHAPIPGYFRRQCEFVVWGTAGDLVRWDKASGGGLFPGCFREPVSQADKFHMTGKPSSVMRWLVSCCPVGGTILDPFVGSGTTMVAAKALGRKAVGIEIEERWLEIAARRLSQEVFQFSE